MAGSRKPLKCWSITLAQNFKTLPEHTRIADLLAEFFDQFGCSNWRKGRRRAKSTINAEGSSSRRR